MRRVPSPVFVLSSIRSGSTLLRVLLNSHSQIHAPHELHLGALRVRFADGGPSPAVTALGLDREQLDFLLWDQLLYRQLAASGKKIIVEKTPGNAFLWPTLLECWPQARFIFLLRHPVSVLESYRSGRPERTLERSVRHLSNYFTGVERARTTVPGITVRYEELTKTPAETTQRICAYLGVPWEKSMLEYGSHNHGSFKGGIGDWSAAIRSGRIQPGRPLPAEDEIPDGLRDVARSWGYLSS